MLKKTSADRKPKNEVVWACLFPYRKGRRCGKTPVKRPVEINFSVFSSLLSFIAHLEICCLLFFTPQPAPPDLSVLFYRRGKAVKTLVFPPVAAGCQGVRSWTRELGAGTAAFWPPAPRPGGSLRLKWPGSNHRNRASAFFHAPACPTVGEGREGEAVELLNGNVPAFKEKKKKARCVSRSCVELHNSS